MTMPRADDAAPLDQNPLVQQDGAPALQRPASAVSTGAGLAGLVGLLLWFAAARTYGMDGINSAFASVVCCGLCMALWSLLVDKVHRRASTGLDWSAPQRSWNAALDLTLVKITGLWATWAFIGLAYATLRFYGEGAWPIAIGLFRWSAIPLAVLSIPYVLLIDRYMVEPKDGSWHFGAWLLGQEGVAGDMVAKHWRAWAVKGFFLAFMLSIVPGNFVGLIQPSWHDVLGNPVAFASFGIGFLYMLDVHFATVGYILTMRPLDAHIRTANPYGMAWVAALICYPPFVLMNGGQPLDYKVNTADWNVWMDQWHLPEGAFWLWAALLVGLTAIYAWATIAFGPRFSNLTHRGIITHGPYRFTRHPAYVAKNSFWWLSSVVILPWDGSIATALRNTVLLGLVSATYYWRAKTEERHLLADPDYRAYWDWAQQNAFIPRLFSRINGMAQPVIKLEPDPRVGPVT